MSTPQARSPPSPNPNAPAGAQGNASGSKGKGRASSPAADGAQGDSGTGFNYAKSDAIDITYTGKEYVKSFSTPVNEDTIAIEAGPRGKGAKKGGAPRSETAFPAFQAEPGTATTFISGIPSCKRQSGEHEWNGDGVCKHCGTSKPPVSREMVRTGAVEVVRDVQGQTVTINLVGLLSAPMSGRITEGGSSDEGSENGAEGEPEVYDENTIGRAL